MKAIITLFIFSLLTLAFGQANIEKDIPRGFYGVSIQWTGQLELKTLVEYDILSLKDLRLSVGAAYRFPQNLAWVYALIALFSERERTTIEVGYSIYRNVVISLTHIRSF